MRVILSMALFTSIALVGCSRESTSPVSPAPIVPVSVSPADGATAVRLDAAVIMEFVKPVDRSIVERNLHLFSEKGMADSLCPVSQTMNHGTMIAAMSDSSIMRHLGQVHALRGRFSWNAEGTSCTFRPDSTMAPNMQYMIHIGQEMMTMMRDRMGNAVDGMMGGGVSLGRNEAMLHFMTLKPSTGGGGHWGHH